MKSVNALVSCFQVPKFQADHLNVGVKPTVCADWDWMLQVSLKRCWRMIAWATCFPHTFLILWCSAGFTYSWWCIRFELLPSQVLGILDMIQSANYIT